MSSGSAWEQPAGTAPEDTDGSDVVRLRGVACRTDRLVAIVIVVFRTQPEGAGAGPRGSSGRCRPHDPEGRLRLQLDDPEECA